MGFDLGWYALRVTYSREMAFKSFLDGLNIGNFIPMHYVYTERKGVRMRRLVPRVHNLIFVYSSRSVIDDIKVREASRFPVRYIMDRGCNRPIVVPEKQMRDFIAVAGSYDEQILYLNGSDIPSLQRGCRVRIREGIWKGVEGIFMRVCGDRRVVVSIEGIMAVATAFVHPSLIERLDD